MRAILLIVIGVAGLMLALFFVLPVAVNLPDSWFGVVIIMLLLGGGSFSILKGVQAIRQTFNKRTSDA